MFCVPLWLNKFLFSFTIAALRSGSFLLPKRQLGQVRVEPSDQLVLILSGKRAGQEAIDPLIVQLLPTGVLVPRINRKE